jgi:hypothetical protein
MDRTFTAYVEFEPETRLYVGSVGQGEGFKPSFARLDHFVGAHQPIEFLGF